MTKALVDHDRVLAFGLALITAVLAFEPRIRGGGFAADDWVEYASVRFPRALGYGSPLAAVQATAGSRVGASLYWLASFSWFGSHTRLYLTLAALLSVVMAFSVYLLLRELRFSAPQSLAMMLLTIAAPIVATVRFWFTPSGSQISLALFFFGLTLALRAFSATGRRRLRLHGASWSLYVLSACYAEVALALMGVCILVYLTRTSLAKALSRWAFDLVVVIVGYVATSAFVSSTAGFVKLPQSMWGYHARLIGDQALTIATGMLDQSSGAIRVPVLIALAGLALAGGVVARSPRTSIGTRNGLRRWGAAVCISIVAIVACFATYIPAMLYYEPSGPGLPSHIDIVIAAPLAVAVFGVLMFAWVVIAELLSRVRISVSRYALALVAVWFAVIFVHGMHGVRQDGRIWAAAGDRDLHLLHVLTADLSHPAHGSTIYTFGEAGTMAVGLPLFFSSFELTSAVKIAYDRGDLSAYPVVEADDVVHCAPKGITVVAGSTPLSRPSPYGMSYFFSVASGNSERIESVEACINALSTFRPGPYAVEPMPEWSK